MYDTIYNYVMEAIVFWLPEMENEGTDRLFACATEITEYVLEEGWMDD